MQASAGGVREPAAAARPAVHASEREQAEQRAQESLRSEIHATDSTCCGCTAKSSAAAARARLRARQPRRAAGTRAPRQSAWSSAFSRCGPAGSRPEQARVEHVRQPGERVPVARVEARERPAHPVRREPGLHVAVLGDVGLVVVQKEGQRRAPARTPRARARRSAAASRILRARHSAPILLRL